MANWCRVEFAEQRRVKVNGRWQGWTNALKYLGEDGTYVFTLEGEGFKWDPAIIVFEEE